MSRWRTLAALAALLAVAAGCGSSSGTAADSPTAANAASVAPSAAPSSAAQSAVVPTAAPSKGSVAGSSGAFAAAGTAGASLQTATRLADGRVLLAGGLDCATDPICPNSAQARVFDPATGSFAVAGPLGTARTELAAALLPDGSVLIAGGAATPATELFDPAGGTFSAGPSMAVDRRGLAVARLADGRILVSGGWGGPRGSTATYRSAEIYDPVGRKFSPTGDMTVARTYHTATALSDGRVLIAGGKSVYPNDGLASAEVFDPATGRFTAVGSMAAPRQHATATLLADGRVLVVGGEGGVVGSPLIEIFDPATGAFTTAAQLPAALVGVSATTLSDGRVLIAGGRPAGDENEALDSKTAAGAYLFDPATGQLTATGSLNGGREEHTATLLADGRVLIAGGWRDNEQLSTAEIYTP